MQTEDDMFVEYVDAMGHPMAELYYAVDQDVDWLRRKWSIFKDLFEKENEQRDFLYRIAPNFFHPLRRFLYEDAMLNLCRLTDPAQDYRGNKNLTLAILAEGVSDKSLKDLVCASAEEAKRKCDFARQWRHKRLAHTDLQVFQTGSAALPDVTSERIEEGIASILATVNLVRSHYGLQSVWFLSSDPYGASALLHYLKRGMEAEEKEDSD